MPEALKRKSLLAIKKEISALTGTISSSGTAFTAASDGAFQTELVIGSIVGKDDNGWRVITSITDDDNAVVDSAFIKALSAETAYKHNYATDPTISNADVLQFVDFGMESNRSELEDDQVSDSFDEGESYAADDEPAGPITIALHGSGVTRTEPEAGMLYEGAFGYFNGNNADGTTVAGCTTTLVKLTTGDVAAMQLRIGDAIIVDVDGTGNDYEVTFVTNIATEDLTVSPALSAGCSTGVTVYGGCQYKIHPEGTGTPIPALPSLWVEYYRGNITKEVFKGSLVESLTMEFSTGQIVKPSFNLTCKEATVAAGSHGLSGMTYDSGKNHVARYMVVEKDGVSLPVSNIAFTVTNETYRDKNVTTSGTNSIIRTKRTVSGSFSLKYSSQAEEAAFKAGTTFQLMIVSSEGNSANLVRGNTFAIKFSKVKYTAAPKSDENGVYKYDITFKASKTDGEDSISSAAFL